MFEMVGWIVSEKFCVQNFFWSSSLPMHAFLSLLLRFEICEGYLFFSIFRYGKFQMVSFQKISQKVLKFASKYIFISKKKNVSRKMKKKMDGKFQIVGCDKVEVAV